MEDSDVLRRNKARRDRELASQERKDRIGRAGGATKGLVKGIVRVAGSLRPREGVRNPDDMITRGPLRSAYIPRGGNMNPLPRGGRILSGKELLVGSPNLNPKPKRQGRKGKSQKNTYNQSMKRMRKLLFGG